MITAGYTDGSVVEHSGSPGWACTTRGEVFWYPGEQRMVVPPRSLVEPFPAPTSPQERPEPEGVSAHGSGRQSGMAGLSFPGRGTE